MKALGYTKEHAPGTISPYLPDFIANDIGDVDFALLRDIGVSHILLDLDQTLRRAYSRQLEGDVIEVFSKLKTQKMFKLVAILSNNNRNLTRYSIPIHAEVFQPFWHGGRMVRKPHPLFFTRVMKELGIKPEQAAMIGDKLRTDVVGANKAGIRTVLIKPRGPDYWFDQLLLSRLRERRYYKQALRARRKHLPSTTHYLRESLRQAGLPARHIRRLDRDARGSHPYLATDGKRAVFVKLLSRQHTVADWLFKFSRKVIFRRLEDELPYASPKQALEHEAYVASQALTGGVRTPKVLQLIDLGDYRFALATEYVAGTPLNKLPKRQLSTRLLRDTWKQVSLLHQAGIAHRDLRPANILVSHGKAWIIDFDFATLAASKGNLNRDNLELLVSTALLVGVANALRSASHVLTIHDLRMLRHTLKKRYLCAATRAALAKQPLLLAELRDDVTSLVQAS